MAKFCPQCGAKLLETDKFCPECGASLSREESSNTAGTAETKQEQSAAGQPSKRHFNVPSEQKPERHFNVSAAPASEPVKQKQPADEKKVVNAKPKTEEPVKQETKVQEKKARQLNSSFSWKKSRQKRKRSIFLPKWISLRRRA